MLLEEIIYQILKENEILEKWLASFHGEPAIFYQQAPSDGEWDGRQYPRIIYNLDMQKNAERKCAGSLFICIYSEERRKPPKEVEPAVKECLRDIFLKPLEGPPYACCFARSEGVEREEKDRKSKSLVSGLEVEFDVLEFPDMVTYDPDPILTLKEYHQQQLPGFLVGGPREDRYRAKGGEPAFYFRIEAMDRMEETFTVAWMEGIIAVHIFAPTQEERVRWTSFLMNRLVLSGELTMPDGSPMTLKEVKVNHGADYLTVGQIQLLVRFGILKYRETGHLVRNAGMEIKNGG